MAYKVLLADDSITIQKVVELILSEEDAIVESVGDGSAAMNILETKRPDIVLADIEMPRMNGYELCRKIKARRETGGIPVILLAGAFESFDEGLARSVGADDFIIKPFESNDLLDKIEHFLSATEGELFTTGETVSFEGDATGAAAAVATHAFADAMRQTEWADTEQGAESEAEIFDAGSADAEPADTVPAGFAPEPEPEIPAIGGGDYPGVPADVPDMVSDGEEFGDTEDLWDAEEIPFSEAFEAGAAETSDWTEAVPAGAAESDAVIEGMTEADEELDSMTEADTEYSVEADALGGIVESDKTFEIAAVTEAETILDIEEEAQMLTEAEEEEDVVPLEVSEEEEVGAVVAEAVEAEEELAVAEEAEEPAEAVELEEAAITVEQAEAEVAFMEAIVEAVEAIDGTGETDVIEAEAVAVEEEGAEEAVAIAGEPVLLETAEAVEEAGIAEAVEIEAELEKLEEAILEKAAEVAPAATPAISAINRDEIMQWVREAVNDALAGFAEAETAEHVEEASAAPVITKEEILASLAIPTRQEIVDAMNLPAHDEILALLPTHDEVVAALPSRSDIIAAIPSLSRDEIISAMNLPTRDEIIAKLPNRDEILAMTRETIAASVPSRAEVDAMIRETVAETVKASLAEALPTASEITSIARGEIAARVPAQSEIEGLAKTAMNEIRAFGCEAVNRAVTDDFIADLKSKAEAILWDVIPETSDRLINEVMKDAVAAKLREAEIITESTRGVIQGIISTTLPGTIKDSVEKVTWEVIPEIAKNIIAEEIRKIRAGK